MYKKEIKIIRKKLQTFNEPEEAEKLQTKLRELALKSYKQKYIDKQYIKFYYLYKNL